MAENVFLQEMGQRIFARRKALKLTQEELSEKMGVSIQMISNLELGKKAIRPENLAKLCEMLNVSADYVLVGVDSASPVDLTAEKLIGLTDKELNIIDEMIDYMNSKK